MLVGLMQQRRRHQEVGSCRLKVYGGCDGTELDSGSAFMIEIGVIAFSASVPSPQSLKKKSNTAIIMCVYMDE